MYGDVFPDPLSSMAVPSCLMPTTPSKYPSEFSPIELFVLPRVVSMTNGSARAGGTPISLIDRAICCCCCCPISSGVTIICDDSEESLGGKVVKLGGAEGCEKDDVVGRPLPARRSDGVGCSGVGGDNAGGCELMGYIGADERAQRHGQL